MAKAHIIMNSGSKVTIEGTPEEVANLVNQLDSGGKSDQQSAPSPKAKMENNSSSSKPTLTDLLGELIDGNYFKEPKELGAVKLTLEEQGHYYPVTTLSPALLRQVRKKQLRRIKDNKRWKYVG